MLQWMNIIDFFYLYLVNRSKYQYIRLSSVIIWCSEGRCVPSKYFFRICVLETITIRYFIMMISHLDILIFFIYIGGNIRLSYRIAKWYVWCILCCIYIYMYLIYVACHGLAIYVFIRSSCRCKIIFCNVTLYYFANVLGETLMS